MALKPLLKLIRISLLLVSVFMVGRCLGQNYALQNSYITNPYLINPAAAASNHLNIFANYRNQWDGLAGAPKIATLGFSTLLDNTRVGIGFKASSFKRGFLNASDASFTYAYGIPVNKQNKLFFGLSGGILSNSVDWGMISPTDLLDPAFANIKSSIAPSLSFGALLKNSAGFNVGIVLPQMLRSEGLDQNFSIAAQDNIMLMASYSNWKAQPKVNSHNKSKKTTKSGKNKGNPFEVFSIFRYSNVGTQVEATAKFNFQSSFWVSGTYRKVSGLIPGLGLNLNNFSLGYFYESGIAGDIPLKSHELSLNIRVGLEKKFKGEGLPDAKPATPTRPRFGEPDPTEPKISKQTPKTKTTTKNKEAVANSDKSKKPIPPKKDPVVVVPDKEVKKDPVVVVPDKEVKKDPVVVVPDKELKKDPVVVVPDKEVKKDPVVVVPDKEVKKDPIVVVPDKEVKKDPVVIVPDKEVKKDPVVVVPDKEVKKDPVVVKPDTEIAKSDPAFANEEEKNQHLDEQDKIARLSDHKENPTEEHNEEGHPHGERHEFVRRGNHQSEMDLGDYVIVGVFRGEANAKHMSEELKKLGFSEVDFGFLTDKAVWYVHIAGSNDIEEAKTKRNKYRKMKMFKDAWLLTVHQ